MRTFVQESNATRQPPSAAPALLGRGHFGHSRGWHAATNDIAGNTTPDVTRFGHDFSRLPVFPEPGDERQHARRTSGELEGGSLNEGEQWLPASGDGGSAAPTGAPAGSAKTPAASTPRLKKSTVNALATQPNGGFSWGAQWSIDGATAATNGWIVQHVVVRHAVEAWHPPLLVGSTLPIVPSQSPYGGLNESWYPLWEAWQVRGGAVFVGGSASAHKADTYSQGPVGANTKGTTEVIGRADFYPNLTLPKDFTVRNAAPAWALPATNTDPGLTGGTGALDHNLTAKWDGVSGTGVTTATTT
jgi:hypothetical protein